MVKRHWTLGLHALMGLCYLSIAYADYALTDPDTGCQAWNSTPLKHHSISWQGACIGGYADGLGSMQWFNNGRPNGRYEGEYKAGKMEGLGTYAMPNGSRYTGHFHNNKRNSQGTYQWEDGTRYEGQFVDNMMQGEGNTYWTDGSAYSGEFKHDKKNGFGTLRLAKQNQYVKHYLTQGQWQGDVLVVQGIFLEDNLLLACQKKNECLQQLGSLQRVLNESEHAIELKEVFKEIADTGE